MHALGVSLKDVKYDATSSSIDSCLSEKSHDSYDSSKSAKSPLDSAESQTPKPEKRFNTRGSEGTDIIGALG